MRQSFVIVALMVGAGCYLPTVTVPTFAQERPALSEDVTYIKLPPGEVRIEEIKRSGKFLYRVSSGKAVIEAKTFFFGNEKGAIHYESIQKATGNVEIHGPGSSLNYQTYTEPNKVKAGSLFVTSPSIIFRWGKDAASPK